MKSSRGSEVCVCVCLTPKVHVVSICLALPRETITLPCCERADKTRRWTRLKADINAHLYGRRGMMTSKPPPPPPATWTPWLKRGTVCVCYCEELWSREVSIESCFQPHVGVCVVCLISSCFVSFHFFPQSSSSHTWLCRTVRYSIWISCQKFTRKGIVILFVLSFPVIVYPPFVRSPCLEE